MASEVIISEILEKKELVEGIFEFIIDADNNLKKSQPGQFIHVKCGADTFLRRPISICDCYDNKLRFIFQVKGKGTEALSLMNVGDRIDLLGPLGKGFSVEKSFKNPVVIGGGIGIYPLYMVAKQNNATAILGFRNKELVTMEKDFKEVCKQIYITTDDGSYERKGLVTDVLSELIEKDGVDAIYACGPMPMLKAIKNIAVENDIFCELSLEERMGCGIGACLCCATKVKSKNPEEPFTLTHVCNNGPVFNANEVLF